MIQDKLDNAIYTRISETGRDVNLIVMHPHSWIGLTEEVLKNFNLAINPYENYNHSLRYRGIRVLRSLDMI